MREMMEMQLIRLIDFVFYNEQEISRALIALKRGKGLYIFTSPNINRIRNGYVSDPTGENAINHTSRVKRINCLDLRLDNPEEWLKVIDETYQNVENITKTAAILKYSKYSLKDIKKRLNITREEYYQQIDKFRYEAIKNAKKWKII